MYRKKITSDSVNLDFDVYMEDTKFPQCTNLTWSDVTQGTELASSLMPIEDLFHSAAEK